MPRACNQFPYFKIWYLRSLHVFYEILGVLWQKKKKKESNKVVIVL